MLTENNIPSMGVCTLYQGWWWILTSLLQWQQHTIQHQNMETESMRGYWFLTD